MRPLPTDRERESEGEAISEGGRECWGVVCVCWCCAGVCCTVLLSICVVWCDGECRLLSYAELCEALIPPSYDLSSADDELERSVPLGGGVELSPRALQSTRVMSDDGLTRLRKRLPITRTSSDDIHTHHNNNTQEGNKQRHREREREEGEGEEERDEERWPSSAEWMGRRRGGGEEEVKAGSGVEWSGWSGAVVALIEDRSSFIGKE